MLQGCVYDFQFSVLKGAAGYGQKQLISLGHTPFGLFCFLLFFFFSLSSPTPCPIGDLHSDITSEEERVGGINRGKRKQVVVEAMSYLWLWYSEGHRASYLIWYIGLGIYVYESLFMPLFLVRLVQELGMHWGRCSPPFLASHLSATAPRHIHATLVFQPSHFTNGNIKPRGESGCPNLSSNVVEEPGLESENHESYLCDIADWPLFAHTGNINWT